MTDSTADQKLISIDQAQEVAERYLRDRYYDFEKISFSGNEVIISDGATIYRLYGGIRAKSRSLMDQVGFFKKADTYKFIVDINALGGRIINYQFK